MELSDQDSPVTAIHPTGKIHGVRSVEGQLERKSYDEYGLLPFAEIGQDAVTSNVMTAITENRFVYATSLLKVLLQSRNPSSGLWKGVQLTVLNATAWRQASRLEIKLDIFVENVLCRGIVRNQDSLLGEITCRYVPTP